MVPLQAAKYLQVIAPVAIVDNASWTTVEIDTLDYDHCTIIFNLGATDIAMAALNVTQSDSAGSGHALITGCDADGGTDIEGTTTALPSATDDDTLCVFQIDLKGKKRYLDLVATAGDGAAGSYGSAVAILTRAANAPTTVAASGDVDFIIRV